MGILATKQLKIGHLLQFQIDYPHKNRGAIISQPIPKIPEKKVITIEKKNIAKPIKHLSLST